MQCKRWLPDGTTAPAKTPKNFRHSTIAVSDIATLSAALTGIETDRQACVIRGKYVGDAVAVSLMRALPKSEGWKEGCVLRRSAYFTDAPRRAFMLDIDKFTPTTGEPCVDTVACIDEFIQFHLPECFYGISYHWQLSGSGGLAKNTGILKAHVWFWLTTPYTGAQLTAWCTAGAADGTVTGLDATVLKTVQPLYTANPDTGDIVDPVAVRSGFSSGLFGDEVDLVLTGDCLAAASEGPRAPVMAGKGVAPPAQAGTLARALAAIRNDRDDQNGGGGIDRPEWVNYKFSAHELTGGSANGLEVFNAWTMQHPRGAPVSDHEWGNIKSGRVTRTFIYGKADTALGAVYDWEGTLFADLPDVVNMAADVTHGGALTHLVAPSPLAAFTRVKSGKIKSEINNLKTALSRPDVCGFHVRYDTFRDGVMLAPVCDPGAWRPIKDSDNVNVRATLEIGKRGFLPIPKELMRDVIHAVAEEHSFDSAQQWLGDLLWDGVPRVNSFVPTYFGAKDTPFTRAVSLYMWTALAGRILKPGIKADMVPVLIGAQGARKSTAVAALVPSSDFFAAIDLGSPDADLARIMRSKLVIELDELRGLAGRESEAIKSFITRPIDEWTPKYKEFVTKYPRRSVFFGTSNKDDILADETGNRRWLPFRVGMCDVDGINRDRDQLWAEARCLYAANGVMFAAAERLAEAEHAAFVVHDEWDSAIAKWLNLIEFDGTTPQNREFLTGSEILTAALNLPTAQHSPHQSARVKRSMHRLGYRSVNKRVSGQQLRVFVLPSPS